MRCAAVSCGAVRCGTVPLTASDPPCRSTSQNYAVYRTHTLAYREMAFSLRPTAPMLAVDDRRRPQRERSFKAAFHDTDTDILADIVARIVARMAACRATSPFSWPQEKKLQEIARVGRVGEDPREDVDVGIVDCSL